jgi:hypothetical protein
MLFSCVVSSRVLIRFSRPIPLFWTLPNGTLPGGNVLHLFVTTPPASTSYAKRSAAVMSRAMMEACSPEIARLASRIASSIVRRGQMGITGPKTSSSMTGISRVASTKTVGKKS